MVISPKTAFIIGAGASADFGLPLGEEFKKSIKSVLDTDDVFADPFTRQKHLRHEHVLSALVSHSKVDFNSAMLIAREIFGGIDFDGSIDEFLHSKREVPALVDLGRMAIIQAILDCERRSKLFNPTFSRNAWTPHSKAQHSWVKHFFVWLTRGRTLDELPSRFEQTCLIVFNYDRCAETFLNNAIRSKYNVSEEAANEVLKHLTIVHPYGSAGRLPSQSHLPSPSMAFGEEPDSQELIRILPEIRTFTQGADSDTGVVPLIAELLSSANTIAFIGFGFANQNLKLLTPATKRRTTIIGTAIGLSQINLDSLTQKLEVIFGDRSPVHLDSSVNSSSLIHHFSQLLD